MGYHLIVANACSIWVDSKLKWSIRREFHAITVARPSLKILSVLCYCMFTSCNSLHFNSNGRNTAIYVYINWFVTIIYSNLFCGIIFLQSKRSIDTFTLMPHDGLLRHRITRRLYHVYFTVTFVVVFETYIISYATYSFNKPSPLWSLFKSWALTFCHTKNNITERWIKTF